MSSDFNSQELDDEDYNHDLFNELVNAYIPTTIDMETEIPEDDLKLLCLRVKCRVDMSLWNPVKDYDEKLRREGRFDKLSQRGAKKLLLKAINRHKDRIVVPDEYIAKERERFWPYRKKENLMRLNYWKNIASEGSSMSNISLSNTSIRSGNDDSVNSILLGTQGALSQITIHDSQSQAQPINTSQITNNSLQISKDSQSTSTERNVLEGLLCMNTESMELNTEDAESITTTNSEEVYDNFHEYIPSTSTQSQEIIEDHNYV